MERSQNMILKEIPTSSLELNPFLAIGKDMMLVTSGGGTSWNTLTASWGGMGELWERDVIFIFIRRSRYTHEFLEKSGSFTCSFFPPEYKDKLLYLGTHSGRDENKIAKTGLTCKILRGERMTFEEANLVFSCTKASKTEILPEQFIDPSIAKHYDNLDYHTLYVGFVDVTYAAF